LYVDLTFDTELASVALRDEDDLARFSVRVPAGTPGESIARALEAAGAGHLDGEEAAIDVGWLRKCTADRPAKWQKDFDAMLAYAASKGWMDERRTKVTAHLEWL
jgi:hypothetical protein